MSMTNEKGAVVFMHARYRVARWNFQ